MAEVELDVRGDGGTWRASTRWIVAALDVPRMQPGCDVPAAVDPADPSKVALVSLRSLTGRVDWALRGGPMGWVSDAAPLPNWAWLGGSESEWIAVTRGGWGGLGGQRIGADGALVDADPIHLLTEEDLVGDPFIGWNGTAWKVATCTSLDLYAPSGTVSVASLGIGGATGPDTIATGAWYPVGFAGGCTADLCRVLFEDVFTGDLWATELSPSTPPSTWRVAEDAGVSVVDAANVGSDTLALALVEDTGDAELWRIGTPYGQPDIVPLGHPGTAMAVHPDGGAIVTWVDAEHAWADRIDPTAGSLGLIDLGAVEPLAIVDVASSGDGFVVAIGDPRSVVSIDGDGVATTWVPTDPDPTALGFDLAAGADGHFVWERQTCVADTSPYTPYCDEPAWSFVLLELDVPGGGSCHAPESCASGVCADGVCGGVPATTPPSTASPTTAPTLAEPAETAPVSRPPSPAEAGCGCDAATGSGGWFASLLLFARRRR